MKDSRILSGVIAGIVLIGVALGVYFFFLQPNNDDGSLSTGGQDAITPVGNQVVIATVNGKPIYSGKVGAAYTAIVEDYRQMFAQSGRNLNEFLEGASGSYFQLQLAYAATSQIIHEALILEEANAQNLKPAPEAVEEAAQRRLDSMLLPNGVDEEGLRQLFEDPEEKALTKSLLNIPDDSVDALIARLKAEEEGRLKTELALMSILGHENFSSPEANAQLQSWVVERKLGADIVFVDPLLAAYNYEVLANEAEAQTEKEALLDQAISAYQEILTDNLSDDPYVEFYLAQVSNLRARTAAEINDDLISRAQENLDAQNMDDEQRAEQIARERQRENVQQGFQSFEGQTDRDFELLILANPNNPVSYVQYARFLMTQPDRRENDIRRHLEKAIDLNENYIDAYVFTAEVDSRTEFYMNAIKNLSKAYDLSQVLPVEELRAVMQLHKVTDVKYKLAEAHIHRAEQVRDYPAGNENPELLFATSISEAEKLLMELQTELPSPSSDYAFMLVSLGDVNMIREEYASAEEYYLEALDLSDDVQVQTKLAQAYLKGSKLTEAQELMESVVAESQGYGIGHWTLAQIYRLQGEIEKAMGSFKNAFLNGDELDYEDRRRIALEAIEMDGADVEMRELLATHYLEGHRYSGAAEQYEEILKLQPHSLFANLGLGQILLDKLQYEEASDLFVNAVPNAITLEDRIAINESIYRAERFAAGPGNLMRERGQEVLLHLAELYLEARRLDQMDRALDLLRDSYPDYAPEQVVALRGQLSAVVIDSLPGFPRPDQGRRIILPGESHPEYNSIPPTSGWHYSIPADWGIHESQIEDEVQLRNLSAGGILIQYRPDIDATILEAMLDMVMSMRNNSAYCRLMLAPYEGLQKDIALTAWERIDELEVPSANDLNWPRIRAFIDTFIEVSGPAVGEISCPL